MMRRVPKKGAKVPDKPECAIRNRRQPKEQLNEKFLVSRIRPRMGNDFHGWGLHAQTLLGLSWTRLG